MNNTLKHWKEAATLILAARTSHGNLPYIQQQARVQNHQNNTFDYEVLLLKRSQKSGFMPNAFVFPGGNVEPSDFSSDWIKVFSRYEQKPNFGLGLVKQHDNRSPMFTTDRSKFGSLIPGEVATRICAIRETFEESGILLVVPENFNSEDNQNLIDITDHDKEEISKWRQEVQRNPSQFIQMCRMMRCMPNIWALKEWSNWLTPVFSQGLKSRRFDTAFFICCLNAKPAVSDDKKEVTSFKWWTPVEALEDYKCHKIWIPPPQFYEISRLCHFAPINELHKFIISRSLEGCEQWMPVIAQCEDGIVHTLPGDDLYPEEPDLTGEKQTVVCSNETIQNLVQKGGCFHRVVVIDGTPTLLVNIKPKYKHINPLTTELQSKNKL
ncbi:hypothetical protein XENTR_v10011673 [Xenopus tropicalis]|uniref:Acyl-coenzyme A diphosphatase NUDT19 n=1 Tax=Xenopus tropicalis TaxID=8364 RepID=F7C9X4_XENTR|eukprot:XP_012816280.1 PREDICTED: nucleoside diphosphate-linked moiety X motif 19 isoform X1 [Xenopus tropicalis]